MSDKKQSSVEWLFEKLSNTPQNKFDWYSLLQQAKEMHQKEIEEAYDGVMFDDYGRILNGKEYYNEIFNK